MINTHLHSFKIEDVPNNIFGFMTKVLKTKVGYFLFSRLLSELNPFSTKDKFDRLVKVIKISKLGSQKSIIEENSKWYPDNTNFVILSMDMAFMGAGKVEREYYYQLNELYELTISNKKIIPFIHIDPRRNEYNELFKLFIISKGFKGVKLYPPLGIYPFDERLDTIYQYCQSGNLPIITHGSPLNPVHFKGSHKELVELLKGGILPIDWTKKDSELCAYFTHPLNYKKILEKYPTLRICIAHYGSMGEWERDLNNPGDKNNWKNIITKMLIEYPNFYTDISYTMSNKELWPAFKLLMITYPQIRNKVLFGDDYYMSEAECNTKQWSMEFRVYLGEELWDYLTNKNPNSFLRNK